MALLNPLNALVVPFLFVVTVPLALFAGITSSLAFAVLMFRVAIVYLDVALSLLPQSLTGIKRHRRYTTKDGQLRASLSTALGGSIGDGSTASTHQQQPLFQRRRRRRPSSTLSMLSTGGSTTPVNEYGIGLMSSIGPERDFEGIGGWRSGGDDEVWTTINSRMELPDRQHARNHYRSASGGGATTPGDGGVLMMKTRRRSPESRSASRVAASPNSSRARTPSLSRLQIPPPSSAAGSYFPLTMSPKSAKKLHI